MRYYSDNKENLQAKNDVNCGFDWLVKQRGLMAVKKMKTNKNTGKKSILI